MLIGWQMNTTFTSIYHFLTFNNKIFGIGLCGVAVCASQPPLIQSMVRLVWNEKHEVFFERRGSQPPLIHKLNTITDYNKINLYLRKEVVLWMKIIIQKIERMDLL